ncbi:MAG: holo-ACP synthase [Anaerolineaceae bacterium]|nr:holo-ACP synthase [Anaerolineaceae bacterium]
MNLRTGVDLIEIDRLENLTPAIRQRFLKRVFTPRELQDAAGANPSLIGKFAAKEAVSKALGCGIGAVSWQEIEILSGAQGQPQLVLHGKAAAIAARQGLSGWSVSISHSRTHAIALAAALAPADTPAGGSNAPP